MTADESRPAPRGSSDTQDTGDRPRPSSRIDDDWQPTRPFLVVVRAGRQSLHAEWLEPSEGRNFDLLVSAYDASVPDPRRDGVFHEHRTGRKVAGYGAILHDRAAFLRRYRYVALLDDDLSITSEDLSTCFRIASDHGFKICQPSLDPRSHFTFAALLQNRSYLLRHVNYVEMMCPIFRTDILEEIGVLYTLGYESGIDLVWCNVGSPRPGDYGVIDAVSVRHTRPVGVRKSDNGFSDGRRYEDDIYAVLERFALPWLGCVPYCAIKHDGTQVRNRLPLFLSSLKLVGAVFRQPGWRERARHVLVHWKHLLSADRKNLSISLRENGDGSDMRPVR